MCRAGDGGCAHRPRSLAWSTAAFALFRTASGGACPLDGVRPDLCAPSSRSRRRAPSGTE
ncbi:hypothetical protein GCM10023405_09110 [Streptomonospora salina]